MFFIELSTGKKILIRTDLHRGGTPTALSPDGKWLAYTNNLANYFSKLMLYEFSTGASEIFVLSSYLTDATVLVLTNTTLANTVAVITIQGRVESFGSDFTLSVEYPELAGIHEAIFTLSVGAANANIQLTPGSAELTAYPTPLPVYDVATGFATATVTVHKSDKTILATASINSDAGYQFGLVNFSFKNPSAAGLLDGHNNP